MDNAAPITRAEHNEFVKRIEDEEHRQNRRLEELESNVRQIQALTISVERMACSIQQMTEELKTQGRRLDGLEDVPAQDWKTLKAGIIGAVSAAMGAGLVTAIVSHI